MRIDWGYVRQVAVSLSADAQVVLRRLATGQAVLSWEMREGVVEDLVAAGVVRVVPVPLTDNQGVVEGEVTYLAITLLGRNVVSVLTPGETGGA